MKKKLPKVIFAVILSIVLCVPSALAVLYYTKPMEDISYNLSLMPEDGQEWEGEKGWTVYTDEHGEKTELTADGTGGYTGLSYAGQTFYFSRELTEELDSPTLRIGAVNRTVSVFLDDDLIYTDCPELDNEIGQLTLPMLEFDRTESVIVSLPPDYLGQTLTIAQSSPLYSETQIDDVEVYPCDVTLYCGYAYESSLIASASKTMLPTALLFALELFLLAVFIWNASMGRLSFHIPVFALAVLVQILGSLAQAYFYYRYFRDSLVDPVWMSFHLSVSLLLLLFTLNAGKLRPLYLIMTILQWSSSILFYVTQAELLVVSGEQKLFFMNLPQITGFIFLLAALIGAFILWRMGNKETRFFHHLSKTALILTGNYILFLVASKFFYPEYISNIFTRLRGDTITHIPNASLKLVWNLCLVSSLAAVVLELFEQELELRTEHTVLSVKNELALESYENLRQQSEEVMMLRHDIKQHYSLLRTMAKESPQQIEEYLNELIGQVENVRSVVTSKNQTLNILLNGKLNTASQKGISTEIVRSDAPEELPLTDAELCCLVTNILDNAIKAASAPESTEHYIKLDFHCKDRHFVFSCKNSMPEQYNSKKNPTPGHGYGVKIIQQIMRRFGDNMVSTERAKTEYKITIVIPLSS